MQSRPNILVVDDDLALLRTYERILRARDFAVETAANGAIAAKAVEAGRFDVVVSDLEMPGLDGIRLLRAVREHDLDLPVLLVTANPSLETAVQALDYGALRYLIKPIGPDQLIDAITRAVQLRRMAAIKREALRILESDRFQAGDKAGLETTFDRAVSSLWMAYQPIVTWSERKIYASEALVRSREPAMPSPGALFDAAERLGRLSDVGRRIRALVAVTAAEAQGALFFVNLHPAELDDEELYAADAPLTQVASRVVLEITERASLHHVSDVRARITKLRKLGYRIAVDDLGAGYAGLATFAQLEPDVVKIDMSLVRDIHRHATKRTLVRSLVALSIDLGLQLVVEGVESAAERDTLVELGCDLLQGYFFARPAHPLPAVTW